jgi:hypothetical protein
MDLQEPARKKLKELSNEERKLKERIKAIQTEKKAIFRMLTAGGKEPKKRKGKPMFTESVPPSKPIGPNQR